MSYNFFIIGGDLRMIYLAYSLSNDGNKVKITGFDKYEKDELLNNNIKKAHSINDVEKGDILISSIPLTVDKENVYAPYSGTKIKIKDLKDKKIIAGKLPADIKGWDLLKNEKIAILNAIPTAEGAISKAIELTKRSLWKENTLVLGYGKVGKILSDRLNRLGANVYCEARKERDLAFIEAYGYQAKPLNELNKNLCKMKVIFNTVPNLIIDKSRIILLKNDTVVIDLASGKGGVDLSSCKKQHIKAIQYNGIPGKVAPLTSAEYIKKYIYEIIKK